MTNQLASESNRPSNVGDDGNLPPDVRAVAGLRSHVIAWTTKDPKYGCDCATTVRMACVIACFPLFFYKAIIPPEHNRAHWILTETELKFVIVNHEEYFLPGIKQTKDIVHTIPLDKITACGVRNSYWYWSSPYIYVDVSESYRDYGIMESTQRAVAPALAGQDWFAQEILHRRNTLKATVGTVIRLDDIPSPSTKAPFGNHDNAPNTMRQWAQQGQHCIVAWTTQNPPKQFVCLFILLYWIAWCYVFLALTLSSPVLVYLLVTVANGHPLLPFLNGSGTVFATMLLLFAFIITVCLREELQDNYWVITETDLFVLTKRQVPFHSLDINRKIPLLSISRCLFTTNEQGLLDWWGASLARVVLSTTTNEYLGLGKSGFAVAENEWFMLEVLSQREKAMRIEPAIEVFA
jgi:hypothetical protein